MTNMEQSGLTTTTRVVIAVADALEGASEQLCELDAVAGDGDHGLAMAGASRNIRSKLTEEPPTDARWVPSFMFFFKRSDRPLWKPAVNFPLSTSPDS